MLRKGGITKADLQKQLDTSDRTNLLQVSRSMLLGDVTSIGYTKGVGVFAEGAAKIAAASIIAAFNGNENSTGYNRAGTCYIDMAMARWGK